MRVEVNRLMEAAEDGVKSPFFSVSQEVFASSFEQQFNKIPRDNTGTPKTTKVVKLVLELCM